ncbi:MAG: glycoside hydrolase family 1 protein [Candidatus Sericytochromatia bacterium]|nr:glycoside hydrolase family 1 protein [Candidatus Tanganyikabacteria bacterium]
MAHSWRRRALAWAIAAGLLTAGCGKQFGLLGSSDANLGASDVNLGGKFPPGFMWGVATAGFQSEGGETPSNWAPWEREGKLGSPRKKAVDFWNRYGEDLDLAKGMGLNAFRMSVEWSRIEPTPGKWDEAALAHYRKVVDAALARGLQPILTLQHFVYPEWLDGDLSPDGFENPETPKHFARYARRVAQEFKGKVKYWITINEPNVLALGSYGVGFFPPGNVGWGPYARASKGIVAAHRAAYDALHEVDPGNQVSSNVFYVYSEKPSKYDPGKLWGTTEEVGVLAGEVPPHLAGPYIDDLGARHLDYIAIDYYWGIAASAAFNTRKPYLWPVYPKGLEDACTNLWNTYRKPILIAENGLATKNLGKRDDGWTREAFMVQHLYYLRQAMQKGAKVVGYVHWSITDNYEWGDWTPRFGLYSVDGLNDPALKRVPTPAVDVYRQIAGANSLSSKLVWEYMGVGTK